MVRLIDEKKLIEELRKYADELGTVRGEIELANGVLKAISIINEQQKVGEWIPCSERLPEKSLNSVIGWDTYRERCVFVQYYMNEWILGNHESVNIVAWQPLPEPYEVKENE